MAKIKMMAVVEYTASG